MTVALLFLLRIGLIALIVLPVIVPTVPHPKATQYARSVTLVTNKRLGVREQADRLQVLKETFGHDATVQVQNLHSSTDHPLVVFDRVGQAVRKLSGTVVLDLKQNLWGDAAQQFNSQLRKTGAHQRQMLHSFAPNAGPNFLMIASLYVPKVTFLGEETLASVEIVGQLDANEERQVELIIRANKDLITTTRHLLQANDQGVLREVVEVPVSFLHARTQILNASLQSDEALAPFNSASTTVFVAHGKTTVLHVAVGPDWSLRSLRHKLKFWPNLDLLSYYILRERWDEQGRTSEMSLIEFPSDKLFGEQLPNFHGIVAQNFYFDHYLQQRDALNLVNYVRQGGRMYLHPGPLSFLSDNPAIQELSPCQNKPRFNTEAPAQRWQPAGQSGVELPTELAESLTDLTSSLHFEGCEPKPGVFVLAELEDGTPILLASNLQKGLVVTSLAADWHTYSDASSFSSSAALLRGNLRSAARDRLSHWLIEFLQRRQDSGLRPPDLAGPRIFAEDTFLSIRSRGATTAGQIIQLADKGGSALSARTVRLPFLKRQGLRLEKPLSDLIAMDPSGSRFTSLQLSVSTDDPEIQAVTRGGDWPLHSREQASEPENPQLLEGISRLTAADPNTENDPEQQASLEQRPLLEAHPYLVALALLLLALDTAICQFFLKRRRRA